MSSQPLLLDVFSGIAGFSLAFESAGFRTIGFSEIDPYASAVLAHRFPEVPNFGAIQQLTRDSLFERTGITEADRARLVIAGGFPCQGHSLAGKRKGAEDERNLWPECVRLLRDIRPRFALFENVLGLLSSDHGLFFNAVLSDLAALRYACQWQVVSAADVGAPHRRERVWLLCVDELADSGGIRQLPQRDTARHEVIGCGEGRADAELADTDTAGCRKHGGREPDGSQLASPEHGSRSVWPARSGHWPARPGQPQHGWEPPRVVGDTASVGRRGRDNGNGWDEKREVQIARPRTSGNAESTDSGKAESQLGRDANGLSDRLDATAGEVREAEREAVMWPTPEGMGGGKSSRGGDRKGELLLGGLVKALPQDDRPQNADDTVNRVNRLKALGDAIVPSVAMIFAGAIYDVIAAESE
jgi:DNA (cytosine-5)-methyltransferase 1